MRLSRAIISVFSCPVAGPGRGSPVYVLADTVRVTATAATFTVADATFYLGLHERPRPCRPTNDSTFSVVLLGSLS